ncbi:MAG: enoyl-CoA hydratase, partial [Steroidobacteraceae bacterium]
MYNTLQVEKVEGYAVVTLNRPQARNALSHELMGELAEALAELERDTAVRVLILTGAGRAFCAGLDLKELGKRGLPALDADVSLNPVKAVQNFSGPVIAAVNGVAVTGGFELVLACDVILAAQSARFADTHARIGVMPGWGLSQRLSRVIGVYRAKEMSLSGNFIDAERAFAWGLVNRVVRDEELLPQARALAQDMLSVVPQLLTGYKALIDAGAAMN